MAHRFTTEDVLGLIVELDGEYHDGLDANVKAAIHDPQRAFVELTPVVTDGGPLAPEMFCITVERVG
jgi:hypothetical protein